MINIGLESHINLNSPKLFCSCDSICSICLGVPGSLPLPPDQRSIDLAKMLVEKLDGELTKTLCFHRKHYFYPDLPNGYQRTQHPDRPFAKNGILHLPINQIIRISSFYLEEDPASIKNGLISYQRCGKPLLEVVSEMVSREDPQDLKRLIKYYLWTLASLAVDLGVSEKSKVLKTDLNVSIENGPRYEIKNITSVRDILKAFDQSLIRLKDDRGDDKTFHYGVNGLVYSRPKLNYIFTRQTNVNLLTIHAGPPGVDVLYDRIKSGEINVENYGKLIGKSEEDLELQTIRDEVLSYLKENPIDVNEYRNKGGVFIDWIKNLKKSLVDKRIKFNSNVIITYLNQKIGTHS